MFGFSSSSHNDDDDTDFNIIGPAGGSSGSKLASLFSRDQQSIKDDQSLFYVPPKQPKPKSDSQNVNTAAPGALTALHAAALHAYKLENGQWVSQGKLGAAIVGNHQLKMYKFILYTAKKQEVTSVTITPSFVLTVQQNNYINFYTDGRKDNWSAVFDSEQGVIDFAKQLSVAKANSAGDNLKQVIVQDLVPGEGTGLENGDAAEVAYTGYLLTNNAIGQVFDSNTSSGKLLRVKLGRNKINKAIEESLVGAKKNGRRLLIVPPSYEGGSQGFEQKVPPNSTLIFDITVNKVKQHNQQQQQHHSRSSTPSGHESEASDSRKPDVVPKPHSSSISDDTIRSRGASLSEQLTQSPKSEKAKIISRMAKMGMPMLPMQGATHAQPSSDSENDEEDIRSKSPTPAPTPHARTTHSPKPSPKPRTFSSSSTGSTSHQTAPPTNPIPVQQMSVYQPMPQYPGGQPYPYGYPPAGMMPPQYPPQPYVAPSCVADTHLPLLLSESRSQSTELRMSLSKLSDKVDSVLNKLDEVKSQSGPLVSSNMPYMEAAIMSSNLQRIFQENERLKKEVDEKTRKIETLNEKICDLLQKNQKFMEENQLMLEQRSDSFLASTSQSQARLLSLEQEKAKLASDLSEALSQVGTLQLDITRHQKTEENLRQQLQEASLEAERTRDEAEALKSQHQHTADEMSRKLQEENAQLRSLVSELQSKVQTLESTKEDDDAKRVKDGEEAELRHGQEIERMRHIQEQNQKAWAAERLQLQDRIAKLESKIQESESLRASDRELIVKLEAEVKELSVWKSKYETVYKSAQGMKEKYEQRMQQLVNEMLKLRKAAELKPGASLGQDSEDFETELKKIMNALYKLIQPEFQKQEQYQGSDILRIILEKVRFLTLRLLDARQRSKSDVQVADTQEKEAPKAIKPDGSSDGDVKTAAEAADTSNNKEHASSDLPTITTTTEKNVQEEQPTSRILPDKEPPTETTPESRKAEEEKESQATDEPDEGTTNVSVTKEEVKDAVGKESGDTEASKPSGDDRNKDDEAENGKTTTAPSSLESDSLLLGAPPVSPDTPDGSGKDAKKYMFFDTKAKMWRPQPPPPPLFDEDEEDDDDWLK